MKWGGKTKPHVWSSIDLCPTPPDVKMILEMVAGEEVHVVREGKNALVFRDNEYVGTGSFYCDTAMGPEVQNPELLAMARLLAEFSPTELFEKAFENVIFCSRDSRRIAIKILNNQIRQAVKDGWLEKVEGKYKIVDS